MKGICSVCGCTESNACVSADSWTCYWVSSEEDLCSYCYENELHLENNSEEKRTKLLTKIYKHGEFRLRKALYRSLSIQNGQLLYFYLKDGNLIISKSKENQEQSITRTLGHSGKLTVPKCFRDQLQIVKGTTLRTTISESGEIILQKT